MRLIEDLKHSPTWATNIGPHLKARLDKAQVIVADDVCQYFFAINDKEHWHEDDFPNVAPPFETFWLETKHPTHINSEEYGITPWKSDPLQERPFRWGAIFAVVPKEKLLHEPNTPGWGGRKTEFYDEKDLDAFRWLLEIVLFVEYTDSPISPIWAWSMPIKEDGGLWSKYDPVSKGQTCGYSYSLLPSGKQMLLQPGGLDRYHALRASAHTMLNPLLLALCFMHCKNVEIKTVRPPEKLRKRNAKRGREMITYRTVQVAAIRRLIEASRRPGDTDITMALHRCRGHFKTYTAERPLLGRAVGTYFWNEQLRGGKKKSVVLHDYNVKAPSK